MKRLDLTIFIGLMIGLAAIGGSASLEGIRLGFLWQPTAALVVLGGTIGAVIIRRGIRGLKDSVRATLALCLRENTDEMDATLARLTWIARAARREGVKVFETYAENSHDPLIVRALTMAAEYAEPEVVRAALSRMLDNEDEEGLRSAATLEAAGGYAPTFGILGAVLGLIHVLRSLNEPSALGAGIATAFVATIYGVGIANLILFPLGSRLRDQHESRMKRREALADALVALAAHESPSAITHRFTAHVSLSGKDSAMASRKVMG